MRRTLRTLRVSLRAPACARAGAAVLAVILSAGLVACDGADRGEPAPDYAAATLDGDPVRLADLRGEVVLLNVWATWCAPCRVEIPELQALHERYAGDGLHIVGVSVDGRNAEAEVRAFIDEFGMTYDVWWDPDQVIIHELRAVGVPLTILIDRGGRIVWRHLGAFERGDPELLEAVRRALGAEAPASRPRA